MKHFAPGAGTPGTKQRRVQYTVHSEWMNEWMGEVSPQSTECLHSDEEHENNEVWKCRDRVESLLLSHSSSRLHSDIIHNNTLLSQVFISSTQLYKTTGKILSFRCGLAIRYTHCRLLQLLVLQPLSFGRDLDLIIAVVHKYIFNSEEHYLAARKEGTNHHPAWMGCPHIIGWSQVQPWVLAANQRAVGGSLVWHGLILFPVKWQREQRDQAAPDQWVNNTDSLIGSVWTTTCSLSKWGETTGQGSRWKMNFTHDPTEA